MVFDVFSRIIHTLTTKNADEKEGFRKWFQKLSLLKTHRFEKLRF